MRHLQVFALLSTALLMACAPLAPEPGMTFKDFNSKSALNMRGYLVPAGVYKDDGVARYETRQQKSQRERGGAQPENGWVFYYEKDGVMISEAELLSLQEKRQRESQVTQSRARQEASSRGLLPATTNQTNTNQRANSSSAKQPARPLGVLFAPGGLWVASQAINQSNLSCTNILANSDRSLVFLKFEPEAMMFYVRIGGKHPYRRELGTSQNKDIPIPTRIDNVKINGNLVTFDRYDYPGAGTVLGGTYQLDVSLRKLRQIRSHTCQNCSESQMRIHMNNKKGASYSYYWCID